MDEVEKLIQKLKNDPDGSVRLKAAWKLGEMKDPRAVPSLIDALKDDLVIMRENAAEGLTKIGDAGAVPALIEALEDDVVGVKQRAAKALGRMDDPRAVDALIGALQDDNWGVRSNAAEGLGNIGNARAVPRLIMALADYDISVRRKTVEVLIKLASVTDMDLPAVSSSLRDYTEAIKSYADDKTYEKARVWARDTYIDIAKTLAESKKSRMSKDGILLEGTLKPPRKKGMYRMRRVING